MFLEHIWNFLKSINPEMEAGLLSVQGMVSFTN